MAIPDNRIAPVTAHATARINQPAPGRVILGLGTGFTGRNTMGLQPLPLWMFGRIGQCLEIATPTHLHTEHALMALDRRKPVVLEKVAPRFQG